MTGAGSLHAPPAAVRNAGPILAVLQRVFAPPAFTGKRVLEIAAGSGYHSAAFARAFPALTWQPTDADATARASIAAYVTDAALPNLCPPLALDVLEERWPIAMADAVLCINMIHISPWEATTALFRGARTMKAELIVTYGPYSIDGDFLAESNVAFDQSLRLRNAAWGLRDVKDVTRVAAEHGFRHDELHRMPANNLMLVFRR
jgi:Protein of unknown function (DUF938)